jgi:hypothetical protein
MPHDPPADVLFDLENVFEVDGYLLEVDTSVLSQEACAAAIRECLVHPPAPSAFERLAQML